MNGGKKSGMGRRDMKEKERRINRGMNRGEGDRR